jgi:hypothetical protein
MFDQMQALTWAITAAEAAPQRYRYFRTGPGPIVEFEWGTVYEALEVAFDPCRWYAELGYNPRRTLERFGVKADPMTRWSVVILNLVELWLVECWPALQHEVEVDVEAWETPHAAE